MIRNMLFYIFNYRWYKRLKSNPLVFAHRSNLLHDVFKKSKVTKDLSVKDRYSLVKQIEHKLDVEFESYPFGDNLYIQKGNYK